MIQPTKTPMILASRSSRRRQLLDEAGYQYEIIIPSSEDESGLCSKCSPAEMVAQIAFHKARDVAQQIVARDKDFVTNWGLASELDPSHPTPEQADALNSMPNFLILACDTLAELDGQVLGKPDNMDHARRMLTMLRGREHRVLSGICLWNIPAGEPDLRVAVTRLRMDDISDADLEEYLETGKWEGKAGSFGYQDGWDWLHVLEGSESNVVGLPMEMLKEMLAKISHVK
jgi:septum formation protein